MEAIIKIAIKLLFKIFLTPVLILVALVILLVYIVFGLVVVPAQTLRYLGLTSIAAIRSAFENKDFTNVFLDALYEFLKKYFAFFGQIFYIPLAIWLPAEENPSSLSEIVKYEWEILSNNWISTILIFATTIFSFAFSFTLLGVNVRDHFKSLELPNSFTSTKDTTRLEDTTTVGSNTDTITKAGDELSPQLDTTTNIAEPTNPYGEGLGALSVYSACKTCGDIQVWVDNKKVGKLKYFFHVIPDCQQDGTLFLKLSPGKHIVRARDLSDGATWSSETITIVEGECLVFGGYSD